MNIKNIKEVNVERVWKNFYTHVSEVVHLDCLKNTKSFWYSFLAIALIFIAITPLGIETVIAAEEEGKGMVLLENYGSFLTEADKQLILGSEGSSKALATYIDMIVKIAFGFGSIAAVVLIVYQGVKYITSLGAAQKMDSKNGLIRGVGALVLLFSVFIFFNTLNPELLKVRFKPLVAENNVQIDLAGSSGGSSGMDPDSEGKLLTDDEVKEKSEKLTKASLQKYPEDSYENIPTGNATSCLKLANSYKISFDYCMRTSVTKAGTYNYSLFVPKEKFQHLQWKTVEYPNIFKCTEAFKIFIKDSSIDEVKNCKVKDPSDHSRNPNVPHILRWKNKA